jgi:hypothetical protein
MVFETITTEKLEISKHLISQEIYRKVLGDLHFYIQDNEPIHKITIKEAIRFCNKLSEIYGLPHYYTLTRTENGFFYECGNNNGVRLLTKQEWEQHQELFIKEPNFLEFVWEEQSSFLIPPPNIGFRVCKNK